MLAQDEGLDEKGVQGLPSRSERTDLALQAAAAIAASEPNVVGVPSIACIGAATPLSPEPPPLPSISRHSAARNRIQQSSCSMCMHAADRHRVHPYGIPPCAA